MTVDRETTVPGLRVELFVRDARASAAFYVETLGFQVLRDDPSGYLSVGREGAVIGLQGADQLPDDYPISIGLNDRPGRGVELVVMVADVEAACEQAVVSGWPLHAGLQKRPWGLTDFRVVDPDGYYVRLTGLSEPA